MNGVVDFFKQKVNVGVLVLILLTGYNSYMFNVTNEHINVLTESVVSEKIDATIEYAFNVVAYGLKETNNDQEVIDLINIWIADKWGAQIGALQTICDVKPEKLQELMSQPLQVQICRQVG